MFSFFYILIHPFFFFPSSLPPRLLLYIHSHPSVIPFFLTSTSTCHSLPPSPAPNLQLAGLILIGGGAYIQSQNFEDVINLSGTIAAGSIIVGVFVVVISFLGCFGAANEKGMLLKTYFALLLLVVVLELGVGGAAYTKKDDVNRSVRIGAGEI